MGKLWCVKGNSRHLRQVSIKMCAPLELLCTLTFVDTPDINITYNGAWCCIFFDVYISSLQLIMHAFDNNCTSWSRNSSAPTIRGSLGNIMKRQQLLLILIIIEMNDIPNRRYFHDQSNDQSIDAYTNNSAITHKHIINCNSIWSFLYCCICKRLLTHITQSNILCRENDADVKVSTSLQRLQGHEDPRYARILAWHLSYERFQILSSRHFRHFHFRLSAAVRVYHLVNVIMLIIMFYWEGACLKQGRVLHAYLFRL